MAPEEERPHHCTACPNWGPDREPNEKCCTCCVASDGSTPGNGAYYP